MGQRTQQTGDPSKQWETLLAVLREQRLEEARALCEAARKATPEDLRWTLGLALCYLGAGRLGRALNHARHVASEEPNNALAFRTVASIHLGLGNLTHALEAALHALRLDGASLSLSLVQTIRDRIAAREPQERPESDAPATVDAAPRPAPELDDHALVSALASSAREVTGAESAVAARLLSAEPPPAQLAALYGSSLFGSWTAGDRADAHPVGSLRLGTRITWQRVVAVPILLGIGYSGVALITYVLDRAAARSAAAVAEQLATLTRTGAVEELGNLVAAPPVESDAFTSPEGSHHAAWRRAHATLYRYHDADPARLAKLGLTERPLTLPEEDAQETITRALLMTEPERAAAFAALSAAATDDAQGAYLLSTVCRRAGDTAGARKQLKAAFALEPTNLVHLSSHAIWLADKRRWRRAAGAVAELMDISPRSAWSRSAAAYLAILTGQPPPAVEVVEGLDAPAPLSGVPAALRTLAEASLARQSGRASEVGALVDRAIIHVRGEPLFLVDFADRFLVTGDTETARRLIQAVTWPTGTRAALSIEGRIAAASGDRIVARDLLQRAWRAGLQDPVAALRLLDTLESPLEKLALLQRLTSTWEHDLAFQARYAEALLDAGQGVEAAQRLRGRIQQIDRARNRRIKATAYAVLAQVEADGGRAEEAIRLATRAAKLDKTNQRATALLDSLPADQGGDGVGRGGKRKKRRGKRGKR